MILVSQNGKTAIDSKDILFYWICTKKDRFYLMAEPRRKQSLDVDYFGLLTLFEHSNLKVVQQVMRFLACGFLLVPNDAKGIIDIDITTLYKFGMEKIEGDNIADN